ncbi:NUDIX domain-containing protein [Agrococcus sp. 1P02AA]|uniref:NUDIX domain-containing protein n=1 Tax=Agrococcus sp. 1P02AA TaxID=3132259 RepID=UPI0039A5B014
MTDDARPGGIRRSARVVCVDDEGAALLLLHHWSAPGVPPRWLTIGGGIEPGETEREAALRELLEETGRTAPASALVGPVRRLRQPTPPGHRYDALDMTTFVWRTPRFEADPSGREPGERASIVEERWWRADEIAASDEAFDREDVAGTLALLAGASPQPGERVRVRASKWDGSRHWEHDAIALGSDAEGVWLGAPGGSTVYRRPGLEPFSGVEPMLTLVPHRPLAMLEGTWALVHWFPGSPAELYVDVATPPTLIGRRDGWVLEYTDLDLDVVRDPGGEARIVDEDELALHAERMGYPAWVRERAETTAAALLGAAQRGSAPGEAARAAWLAALADRSDRRA